MAPARSGTSPLPAATRRPTAHATTSDLIITAGGSLTAPAGTLRVDGDFTQNGSFANNSGAAVFGGADQTIAGNLTGSNALSNVRFTDGVRATFSDNASSSDFTVAGVSPDRGDGTASSTVKISDNENGGPTGLDSSDNFGSALTNLGDLNGDGVPDLAVGAYRDEATSGGDSEEGAVHILFMNSDGTAASTVKISDNENGGPTGLESSDLFGSALTNLGDLNGDGVPDLAVGAYQDEATSGGDSRRRRGAYPLS